MDTKPVYRGARPSDRSEPLLRGALSSGDVEHHTFSIDSSSIGETPPSLPYRSEFCSPTTFKSRDSAALAPLELREALVKSLLAVEVDVEQGNKWEMGCVFYPEQEKTSFLLKMFDNTNSGGKKGACLVEMQLTRGDRFAFEHLTAHLRREVGLDEAFEAFDDGFGFGVDESDLDFEEESVPYEHTTWKPLPLPVSLLPVAAELGADLFGDRVAETNMSPMLEVLTRNTRSCFADVRRSGWQELAKMTGEKAMADALLAASIEGQTGLEMVVSVLNKCEPRPRGLLEDIQRCVLKTLLNLSISADATQLFALRGMAHLKAKVISLSERLNSLETRTLAVALIEKLASADDVEFRTTLETCSCGEKSRVSTRAALALNLMVC